MAIGVGLVEQASQLEQIQLASSRREGWLVFTEFLKPAEQMGIAAQLGERHQLRKIGLQVAEKAPSGSAIAV
jgi:hypothetical protein